MANNTTWTDKHFRQRAIKIGGAGLARAKRIEIKLLVDGALVATMQAREPGLVSLVSSVDDDDIAIVVVEPMEVAYTDADMPGDGNPQAPDRWCLQAIGILPSE